MPRVFVYIVVVSVVICTAHAQTETQAQAIGEEPRKTTDTSEITVQEQFYRKAFSKRRKEHLEVVKNLRKIENYERLYKMVMVLGEKMIEVIESSKILVESAGCCSDNRSFPQDTNVRNALSSILENTALFGDIILHLPSITHRILKAQQKWNATIHWSLNFANRTRHLLDKGTITMLHLVGQELNVTKREPGYFNPYWSSSASPDKSEEPQKKKKPTKKQKRKKGPQMIKFEL